MVTFEDRDGNGAVTANTPNGDPATQEVLQRNLYYPFGMQIDGDWWNGAPTPTQQPENPYLYNGKELDASYGLNWYFYGTRMYDPAVGRFAEIAPQNSTFNRAGSLIWNL